MVGDFSQQMTGHAKKKKKKRFFTERKMDVPLNMDEYYEHAMLLAHTHLQDTKAIVQ